MSLSRIYNFGEKMNRRTTDLNTTPLDAGWVCFAVDFGVGNQAESSYNGR